MIPARRKRQRAEVRPEPQLRSRSHLKWVRGCNCSIAHRHTCEGKIEAAHVRTGTDGGLGVKPSDTWAIPLCSMAHKEQHNIGEPAFERKYGIDMKRIAAALAKSSPHRADFESKP